MNREIQQHITSIYNALDDFDNTRDLLEIRYWLLSSNLGQNDNFLVARFNIEKQKSVVRPISHIAAKFPCSVLDEQSFC